jgi:hypothetical protein
MKNWTKQDEEALQALTARRADAMKRKSNAITSIIDDFRHPNGERAQIDERAYMERLLDVYGQQVLDTLINFHEPSPRAMPAEPEYGGKFIPGLPVAADQQLAKR